MLGKITHCKGSASYCFGKNVRAASLIRWQLLWIFFFIFSLINWKAWLSPAYTVHALGTQGIQQRWVFCATPAGHSFDQENQGLLFSSLVLCEKLCSYIIVSVPGQAPNFPSTLWCFISWSPLLLGIIWGEIFLL